jgi:hypothetical protein
MLLRFEIFIAATMKIKIFLHGTPCNVVHRKLLVCMSRVKDSLFWPEYEIADTCDIFTT